MLLAATWVAVDTEADSLHAYPEKVCLIQISTSAGDRLIDPLAGFSIDAALDALTGHELIMHGADYDLRLLRKHHEFVPKAIFDTMLAARLLGIRKFGLGDLVAHYLGARLEKGPQKANWALRPLTERMERYARNDTFYLKPLADRLKADLTSKGRLGWHQECCERLIAETSQCRVIEHDQVWRIKGSSRLSRPALAVLREVWKWREQEATQANRPPFFVLSHDTLHALAVAAPTNPVIDPLLPKHISERRREGIKRAVERGLAIPAEQQPAILRSVGRRPSEAERRRYHDLQHRRDRRALELDIDPTLVASRAVLSDLAHDWDKHAKDLMAWQLELLEVSAAATVGPKRDHGSHG